MYVPLDHLYHWISSLADQPVNIYYFYPHGSKNLWQVANYPVQKTFTQRKQVQLYPDIFCNDQEPLDFDFYQNISCEDFIAHTDPSGKSFMSFSLDDSIQNLKLAIHAHNTTIYDRPILVHSEKHSRDVAKYQKQNYIPVHYWSHGVISRDWFRFAAHDSRFKNNVCPDRNFLIYSRDWSGSREYRLKFLELLIYSGLDRDCLCYFNPVSANSGQFYTNHVFANPAFQIDHDGLENRFERSTVQASASADYDVDDHLRTHISVVLETQFDDSKIHLTEKICRALACAHPFILCAGPGSLQYLKQYGFQTYHPWIDESYDTQAGSLSRLEMIIESMKKFAALDHESKQHALTNIKAVAVANQKHFFSDQFADRLTDELKTGLADALREAHVTRAKHWLAKRKKIKTFFPHKSYHRHAQLGHVLGLIRNLRRRQ